MQRDRKFDVYHLKVKDIFFDWEFNCRDQFTHESVRELAESIQKEGLHFPIVVQPFAKGDNVKWRIICGHRRFKAVTVHLSWSEIPAMIRDDLTEWQARMLNLRENLERKELNIMEEANAIKALYPDGVSLRVAANDLKRSTRWVQSRLRLLKLPQEIQKKVAAGLISALEVDQLVKLKTEKEQVAAVRTIIEQKQKKRTAQRGRKYRRKFKYRRSKAEVNRMVEYCWSKGLDGLVTRLLAWTNGYIDDVTIKQEIREASQSGIQYETSQNVGYDETEE